MFDRIVQLDSSFKPGRDSQLKNRLAEAVRDDSTRIELRHLNPEHPELSYFDARDRVMKLMSQYGKSDKLRQNTLVQETAADQEVQSILKQQSQQIAAQRKQIKSLVVTLSGRNVLPHGGGPRRCSHVIPVGTYGGIVLTGPRILRQQPLLPRVGPRERI